MLDPMPIHQPEPPGQVRTKIVATVGPASNTPERLRDLMDAGVDVFRLNFSHGTQDDHSRSLAAIRSVADAAGRNIAVLQDLGGPKLRLGPIPGDAIECRLGEEFTLVCDRSSDDPHQLTCSYRGLVEDLKVGDVVLFADGTVAMGVMGVEAGRARLVVTLGGPLRSRQGINLPNAEVKLEALTEKDLADLDWTATHGVEYVGLSFVRKAADVARLREELKKRNCSSRIVAKIEKPQAVDDLDAIIAASDAVMVARGDLGVELDVARVPAIQKRIITACHRARVPVITATQMLNSMENSSRPTRAEATDVFNAVLDGTDAVMLSGETAVGQYPGRVGRDDEPDRPRGRGLPGPGGRRGLPRRRPRIRPRGGSRPGYDGGDRRGREPGEPADRGEATRCREPLGPDGPGRRQVAERHAPRSRWPPTRPRPGRCRSTGASRRSSPPPRWTTSSTPSRSPSPGPAPAT